MLEFDSNHYAFHRLTQSMDGGQIEACWTVTIQTGLKAQCRNLHLLPLIMYGNGKKEKTHLTSKSAMAQYI